MAGNMRNRAHDHGTRARYLDGCDCPDCLATVNHGSPTAYGDGCSCDVCTAGNATRNARQRARRRLRAAAGDPAVPHGRGGYTNWGCRCDICRVAGSEMNRAYRALADTSEWADPAWRAEHEAAHRKEGDHLPGGQRRVTLYPTTAQPPAGNVPPPNTTWPASTPPCQETQTHTTKETP